MEGQEADRMQAAKPNSAAAGGGGIWNWWQYVLVFMGVQALLLMIFKRSSWLFSKEERPMRLRPTLSRVISFTSPAITPLFSPVTRRHSYVPPDDDQVLSASSSSPDQSSDSAE